MNLALGLASSVEGERNSRGGLIMWLAHLVGGVAGGVAVAMGLWLLATPARTLLPDGAQLILFSLAVYLALGVDLRGSVRASRRGRQVPATWLQRFGAVRAYAAYGFLLGGGLITFVPFALAYVVFIAGALYAPAWLVVAVGAGFGFARAFAIGPAALAVEWSSRFLYRGRGAYQLFPRFSAVAIVVLWLSALQLGLRG